jgi:hypothetical protein
LAQRRKTVAPAVNARKASGHARLTEGMLPDTSR